MTYLESETVVKRSLLCIIAILSALATPCTSSAQQQQKVQMRPRILGSGSTNPQQKPDNRAFDGRRELTQMPKLANIPAYTGKSKFLSGYVIPNPSVGDAYFVIFATRETESQVKTWYRSALASTGWTLGSTPATARVISAIKSGNRCSISVNQGRTAEQGAVVSLTYTEPPRPNSAQSY